MHLIRLQRLVFGQLFGLREFTERQVVVKLRSVPQPQSGQTLQSSLKESEDEAAQDTDAESMLETLLV